MLGMRLFRSVVVTGFLLAGLAGSAAASGPLLIIEQPANRLLEFPPTPFDSQSPTQRVVIRNDGDPVYHQWIELFGPYVVVATGGGFATGQEQYWDIACLPTHAEDGTTVGDMRIDVCGVTCDDEWIDDITLICDAGLLDTPYANVPLYAYRHETAHETISFTNPGPDPITITSLASRHAAFSVAPIGATLPVTLAAGQQLDLDAAFTSDGSEELLAYVDVLVDTVIAGRVQLDGVTLHQTRLASVFFGMPLGATYALPIIIHNPSTSPRTITAMASDHPEDVVRDLVGKTLGPGELARGFVDVTGGALGFRDGVLTLAFDGQQADAVAFRFYTEAATYAVAASDATPADGTIDFGTHRSGSPPIERTFTFTNLTASDQPLASCNFLYPPFDIVSTCPTVWPASGSVQLTVRFTPTTPGAYAASVQLVRNDARNFFGFVTARVLARQLALTTTQLAFPDIEHGSSAQLGVSVTNLADDPITVPIAVTGAGFATDTTELAVAAGATADVVVQFQPATAGTFTGTLELGNPGDPDHAIVELSGTALGVDESPPDGGSGDGSDGGPHAGGGCSAGGGAGALAIAMLAILRRRRSPARRSPRT